MNLKKECVKFLCKIGKFGVGKSLLLGAYDFDIPQKLFDIEREGKNLFDEQQKSNEN